MLLRQAVGTLLNQLVIWLLNAKHAGPGVQLSSRSQEGQETWLPD